MVPLEVVFALVVAIWALMGLVRGFSKEAGSTIAVVLGMEILNLFGPKLVDGINRSAKLLMLTKTTVIAGEQSPTRFWFYVVVFVLVALMGYQGETLGLQGSLGRMKESVMGVFLGLINGYLIAGNLWYFLDKYAGYNVPGLSIQAPTSVSSQQIIHFLPLNLLHEPMLMGLLLLFLILRIAK